MWKWFLRWSAGHGSTFLLTTILFASTTAGVMYVQNLRVKVARCEASAVAVTDLADELRRKSEAKHEQDESDLEANPDPCLDEPFRLRDNESPD